MLSIRAVTDPSDPAIAAFGALQERAYFEPDMLIPAPYIAHMLARPGGARRDTLLVAEDERGRVLGGTLFHYLPDAGTGFSSFLGVEADARGRGVARALNAARRETLQGQGAAGVFIDVVNPERLSDEQRAAEAAVGSDPRSRRASFHALGFRTVDVRYEQPVGGEDGGPVTDMDLLYQPFTDEQGSVPAALVSETMRAYWTPWLGAVRAAQHAQELQDRAGGRERVPLLPATASPSAFQR
ncbi:GNAT family N-acetyltransferase [Deinococcus maricopensis]|uniref:GCN5-related N-acetyltransferase n=1 Tax=Deinococcus maricopensis (strain DSM 21211 / LMG 22137 / NRRL B-23946 / LB-34) TaxID=709986 RepID=E8U5M1_DEIML|nr:GNAT family N-acetyltransferase [Deinococcus maricopensis]ADV66360.1 GCN5-related N-acetyltransferase [Deinococcus maricopensis DSM 21211]